MKVLHITPHLGGGIGKAHAVINAAMPKTVQQTFCLLEEPINLRYVTNIKFNGSTVTVASGLGSIEALIAQHDIIQFEYIAHPKMLECLARVNVGRKHTVIWAHQSGLCQPFLPPGLIEQAQRFVFTSNVSLQSPSLDYISDAGKTRIVTINSGFGFGVDNLQRAHNRISKPLIAYLGTVNFVKMHPWFFDALDALEDDVEVGIWGNYDPRVLAYAQTMQNRHRFFFHGETEHPAMVLAMSDIFFYPLQANHYGTGENALVEAMSIGLPPIVMANPAENEIVRHLTTGFVCKTIDDCVRALRTCITLPSIRRRIGQQAHAHVWATRTPQMAVTDFCNLWHALLDEPACKSDFRDVLGTTPAEWFLATQKLPGQPMPPIDQQTHHGAAKGSIGHFQKVFAGDPSLAGLISVQ